MDARKIQFLIGIQREIDKLEAKEGNVPKVEKIKSRFYDVVEVEEMVGDSKEPRQELKVDISAEATEEGEYSKYIHYPKLVSNRLSFFSTDDVYKRFTHETKANEFDYKLLFDAVNWTNDFGKYYEAFNYKTFYRIKDFIFSLKEPFEFWVDGYKIGMTWRSPEIETWSSKHPGEYPLDVEVPQERKCPSSKNPKLRYEYFGEIITEFKHTIEQRTTDRSRSLDETIKKIFAESGLDSEYKIVLDPTSFKAVSFFGDVVQIKQAFRWIFKCIISDKLQLNHEVEIKLRKTPDFYEITITNKGAFVSKKSTGIKIDGTGGDTKTLREELRSVCDWHTVYSTHLKKSYHFKYLTEGCDIRQPVVPEEVDFIDGITHKLIIYK